MGVNIGIFKEGSPNPFINIEFCLKVPSVLIS